MTEEPTTGHLSAGTLYDRSRSGEAGLRFDPHLRACAKCRLKLAWVLQLHDMGPADTENEPPPQVIQKVLSLATNRQNPIFRWLTAQLVFDTFNEARNAGVRRKDLVSRHIVYRSEGREFRINIQSAAERRFSLIGQVVAAETEHLNAIDVWLQYNERIFMTLTDQFGEFIFYRLHPADYKLTFLLQDGPLILPSISMLDQ